MKTVESLRVLVYSPIEASYHHSVAILRAAGLEVVGDFGQEINAATIAHWRPHEAVCEISALSALDALRALVSEVPDLPIVALVPVECSALAVPSIEAGARHFVIKDAQEAYVPVLAALIRHVFTTEAQSKISQEAYRAIIENFPNGTVALFDRDLRYTLMGGSQMMPSGESVREMLEGKRLRDVFPPEIVERDEPHLRAALAGDSRTNEVGFGDSTFVVHTLPVKDPSGEVIGGLVMSQDITERKRMENALLENERFTKQIAAISPYMIFVYDRDLQRNIYVNDFALQFFGMTADDVQGMDWDFLTESLHPDDRGVFADVEEQFDHITDDHILIFEYRMQNKEGHWRWLRLHEKAFRRAGNGEILQTLGTVQDITEQKIAAQRLVESESLFRGIFETLAIGIAMVDAGGTIVRANPSLHHILGYGDEELVGLNFADLSHPQDRALTLWAQADGTATPPLQFEKRFLHKEGHIIWVQSTTSLVSFDGGATYFGLAVIMDVTARRMMEESLLESERFNKQIASIAPYMIYVFDFRQRRNIYANAFTLDFFDVSADQLDLLNSDFLNARLHPENRSLFYDFRHYWEDATDNQIFVSEYRLLNAAGEWRWLRLYEKVFRRDEKGGVYQTLGSAMDITEQKEAAQRLEESEELFRAVFESAAIGAALTRVKSPHHFVRTNARFRELLGYTEAELLQMSPVVLTHPDDFEAERVEVGRVIQGEQSGFQIEKRYIRKDGALIWARLTASMLSIGSEQEQFVLGIVEDITERKQAEERLQLSEERYRTLVENFPNGVVALFDHELRYTLVGGTARFTEGYDMKALLEGKRLQDAFPPEVVARDEPSMRAALNGEMTVREVEMVGRTYSVYTLPITQQDEKVIGGLVMTQDITERKKMENALRDNERFIKEVVDNSPSLVYVYDLEKERLLYWNRYFMEFFALTPDTLPSADYSFLESYIHPDDRRLTTEIITRLGTLPTGEAVVRQMRFKNADETWRWMTVSTVAFKTDAGAIQQILAVAQDITERYYAEQRALELALEREKRRVLTDFIRLTSHEFRTPLSTIDVNLYLLERSTNPDQVKRSLHLIREEAANVVKLVESLATLVQLENEREPVTFAVNLNDIVHDCLTRLRGPLKDKHLHVELDLQEKMPPIQGNTADLYIALTNIVDNAIRYNREGGNITIRTVESAGTAIIEISDTGMGISLENREQIFDYFFRVDKARTTRGFGLGLAIARKIVENHQGYIELESEMGVGSTFRLLFPLTLAMARPKRREV